MDASEFEYEPGLSIPIDLQEQFEETRKWAQQRHTDEAPYHPFAHSFGVFKLCNSMADVLEAQGITVNRRALGNAALGHDVWVHKSLDEEIVPGMIFDSKEERSAWLLRNHLLIRGFDSGTVAQPAYDHVVSTERGKPCRTIEAIILRIADLFNTSDKFEVFEEAAWAVYDESCIFNSNTNTFEEWLPGAMDYIEGFLDEALPEWFKKAVRQNIVTIKEKYLGARSATLPN